MHDDDFDAEFEDAGLRTAVGRCWAGERAPAALRDRVAAQVAGARHRRPTIARFRPLGLAAAAAAAVVVGGRLFQATTLPAASAAVIPVSLEDDLVQTHDHCAGRGDHQHLPVPRTNGYAIAASLRSRLDRPVLVSRPADPAWHFAGASICPVGTVRSAHLVFRRSDGDALSLFSLPRSSAPLAADGTQFQGEAGHHPIVGFVKHGAVYCLVGSGCAADVSVGQLAAVRQQLESQVVVADATPAALPPGGDLIHAVVDP